MSLLSHFKLHENGSEQEFKLYGTVSIDFAEHFDLIESKDVNFIKYPLGNFDICVLSKKEGNRFVELQDYDDLQGYDANYIGGCLVSSLILKNQQYEILSVDEKIKAIVQDPIWDYKEFGDKKVPMRVLNANGDLYQAILITDAFIYYGHDSNDILMVDFQTGNPIATDFFAEQGFEDSLENIAAGTEEELWMDPYEKESREELKEEYMEL